MGNTDFFKRFLAHQQLPEMDNVTRISTIDMHTGGEPLRVITAGFPEISANSLLAYRKTLKKEYDHLRRSLMYEPRGHTDMYGCLLLPAFSKSADCSVIFMHNEGYSNMCGHAVIALMTLAVKMKWVDIKNGEAFMNIEAPCGLIEAKATVSSSGIIVASFECVASFLAAEDQSVFVPQLNKTIDYDLAFGGAFYAYVNASKMGLMLEVGNSRELVDTARHIKQAVIESGQMVAHPFEPEMNELYGVIFIGNAREAVNHSRNVCIFADGEVDRSPTGSGVSGRMAIHFSKGEVALGQAIVVESIIGSCFSGEVIKSLDYGGFEAVIPRITGEAFITGQHQFYLEPHDPFVSGFLVR